MTQRPPDTLRLPLMELLATLLHDPPRGSFASHLMRRGVDGPFDVGAVFEADAGRPLVLKEWQGVPDLLLSELAGWFGALDRIESVRTEDRPGVVPDWDGHDPTSLRLTQALGISSALLLPFGEPGKTRSVVLLGSTERDDRSLVLPLFRALRIAAPWADDRASLQRSNREAMASVESLASAVDQPLIFTDREGVVIRINDAAACLLGIDPAGVGGRALTGILPGHSFRADTWTGQARKASGERIPVKVRSASIRGKQGERFVHALRHSAAVAEQADLLAAIATRDPLTGLANRAGFLEALHTEMALARRYRGWCSVLVLDLDGFSMLNDRLGEEAGSRLLQSFGESLQARLRRSDRVARLHADRFAILLSRGSREQTLALGEQLRAELRNTEGLLDLTVSGGGAWYPDDADTPEQLLDAAFVALIDAKRRGGDRVRLWGAHLADPSDSLGEGAIEDLDDADLDALLEGQLLFAGADPDSENLFE